MMKATPGVYLRQNGELCPDDAASAAGFDIASDRLEMRMREKKAAALAGIDAEFEERRAEIEKQAAADIAEEDAAANFTQETTETPGETPPDEIAADGVRKNSVGEPRETAKRKMDHKGGGKWDVIDKTTGDTIADGLSKNDAVSVLLAP